MSTLIVNSRCPGCKKHLNYHYNPPVNPRSTAPGTWIGTCNTSECDYELVTLEDAQWGQLAVDATMQSQYRGMNRRYKAHVAQDRGEQVDPRCGRLFG